MFLWHSLHPFCLYLLFHQYPYSQAESPLQTSTKQKPNRPLKPMIWTGKIPVKCIKNEILNRCWFSYYGLCSAQPRDQMERGECVNYSALPKDTDQELHLHISPIRSGSCISDAASQASSILPIYFYNNKVLVVRNSWYLCSLFY